MAAAVGSALSVLAGGGGAATAAEAPSLRAGGLVLYVAQLGGDRGCAVDRSLAARLRAETRGLPVGRVLAAPTCAARATARLVFGRATVSTALARPAGARARRRRGAPPRDEHGRSSARPRALSPRARPRARTGRGVGPFAPARPVVRRPAARLGRLPATRQPPRFREWDVRAATQMHPHDIWPAGDGTVWYTAQFRGAAGRLDTATGAAPRDPARRGLRRTA